jgi:hypothetical protein
MTNRKMFLIFLSIPVFGVLAQSPAPNNSSLHTLVTTSGDVTTSKEGEKTILKIIVQKKADSAPAQSRSITVDGDYQIVTDGAVSFTTINGQRTLNVFMPSAMRLKTARECSGACCLTGDESGVLCLHSCEPPKSCRLHIGPSSRSCSCE